MTHNGPRYFIKQQKYHFLCNFPVQCKHLHLSKQYWPSDFCLIWDLIECMESRGISTWPIPKWFQNRIVEMKGIECKTRIPQKMVSRLIINWAQMNCFPCHWLSAKPTHRLSADSVFTHLYISFVMGLPVVNTSPGRQYQRVCTIKYLTSNGSYLVSWLSF